MKRNEIIAQMFISVFCFFPGMGKNSVHAQSIYTIAGTGAGNYNGDGIQATAAAISFPTGVVLDTAGNLYVADNGNNRIRVINKATGIISTVAGNGTQGYSGDGGPATAAELFFPDGLALDKAGNIYFADQGNARVRKVNTSTGIITTLAGTGVLGVTGDGGPATAAELYYPVQVALDVSGNVYIEDAANNKIREINISTGIITTVVGNGFGTPFLGGYSGDGGAATAAELDNPEGLALDNAGNIYIADLANNRIRKVTASTCIISTIIGNGTMGFSGDGGYDTAAELSGPDAIAFDTSGNIYISDQNNNRIREVITKTGIITTVAGDGFNSPNSGGYGGDGGPATAAELYYPRDITLDPSGDIYIADADNNRVREVIYPPCNLKPVINAIPGETIYTGDSVSITVTGGSNYIWTPVEGLSCTTCSGLKASPSQSTDYCVTVIDSNGCKATTCVLITVETPCDEVFIPNAFSPNGDGQNDILYVRGDCIKTMEFKVYDRWGNKVFESESTNVGWDGTYKGEPINTGSYAYYLHAIMIDGTNVEKHGTVTLVR